MNQAYIHNFEACLHLKYSGIIFHGTMCNIIPYFHAQYVTSAQAEAVAAVKKVMSAAEYSARKCHDGFP